MNRTHAGTLAIIGAILMPTAAMAGPYPLIKVVEAAPGGDLIPGYFHEVPTMSNGTASFYAYSLSQRDIILAGNGGPLEPIVQHGTSIPPNTVSALDLPASSDGIVAFRAAHQSGEGVFTSDGDLLTTIVRTGDPAPVTSKTYFGFGRVATSEGLVAVRGYYQGGEAVFTGNGGPLTMVAKTGDAAPTGAFTTFFDPAISEGTVVFRGKFGASEGIFTGSGGPLTTIAQTGDMVLGSPIAFFEEPAISGDELAFVAYNSTLSGLFTTSGGPMETVALTGDPAPVGVLSRIYPPSISHGLVAFMADYKDFNIEHKFQRGAFFGRAGGGVTHILGTGDPLFGGTVFSVSVGRFSLDPSGSGQLAIGYVLEDGRGGVVIATIAEPASSALAALALIAMVGLRRNLGSTSSPQ